MKNETNMRTKWDYQTKAADEIRGHWRNGKSVCLVGPTGCGKTRMGWLAIRDMSDVLWIVHRTDLRRQTAYALRRLFDQALGEGKGRERVAVLMPGRTKLRQASITVASVQTMLEGGAKKALADRRFRYLVVDESAHYRASEWERIREPRTDAFLLGMTAFPQRSDGRGLGKMFSELVVAANYSELVHSGILVRCRRWVPEEGLGRDVAQAPVDAWLKYSEGSKTFAFVHSIDAAVDLANRFRAVGVSADAVTAKDSEGKRRDALAAFRDTAGTKVLCSVDALTEGIDEPQARCALLCRPFRFEGSYVQAVGRILRSCEGKRDAIVIDLVGASLKHGSPLEDRDYSLDPDDPAEPGGGRGGGSGGERGEPGEPEVLDRRLVLVERGAMRDGEETQPVSKSKPLEPIQLTRDIAAPRVTRGTPAVALFGGLR